MIKLDKINKENEIDYEIKEDIDFDHVSGSSEEFNAENWQSIFDNLTISSSPDRLLDHCQQM